MFSKIINRNTLVSDPEVSRICLAEVVSHVSDLKDYYPGFESWINQKVIPGLYSAERSIIIEYRHEKLAGFAVLKDDNFEQKLCCLRVMPEFQNSVIGVRLFERSFDELQTDMPLLSVAEERLSSFKKIFDYFGFELGQEYLNKYRPNRSEYSFNGLLEERVFWPFAKLTNVQSITDFN